jgi:hypothetical protein
LLLCRVDEVVWERVSHGCLESGELHSHQEPMFLSIQQTHPTVLLLNRAFIILLSCLSPLPFFWWWC